MLVKLHKYMCINLYCEGLDADGVLSVGRIV